MLYMVTFTINISQMLAYIPYMDPMGYWNPMQSQLARQYKGMLVGGLEHESYLSIYWK